MSIIKIRARQIYDSRGDPTVEVDVTTFKGTFRAGVPSGASSGVYEALELRDEDESIHMGRGVKRALANINDIIGPAIIERKINVCDQAGIDRFMIELDGTENKSRLGANAILGVSLAVAQAGAGEKGISLFRYIAQLAENDKLFLPVPAFSVISGGAKAGNRLAMQEFMILPLGAKTFDEAMRMGTEVYHHLKAHIKNRYGFDATAVGDEGGFAPNIENSDEALDLIMTAIKNAGHTGKVSIGIDAAASNFHIKNGKYDLDFKNKDEHRDKKISGKQLAEVYSDIIRKYPVVLLEDPFDKDDWESWAEYYRITNSIKLVGDDLLYSNPKRINLAIQREACNSLLIKINQIGSLTETIDAANLAKHQGWGVFISHRAGETEDTFIADLVVGLGTGHIKTGAPCRSERLAKYNQLLRIEEELGDDAVYAGKHFRNPEKN